MTTLTLRDLGFVGGLSGGYTITDADAAAWVASVEGASGDNQPLEDAIKQAVDAYAQSLKSNNIWNSAAQLLLPCGPRTLEGALRPLKGAVPTNVNFVSGNYNRKSGLGKASNTNAYLNSNVLLTALGSTSHALFAYGSIAGASGNTSLMGRHNNDQLVNLLVLDEWAAYVNGRAFRSATAASGTFPVNTSTAAATCMIGSRTSSTSSALYVDSASTTNTTSATLNLTAESIWIYALNNNGIANGPTSAILQSTGIFSAGLSATQAAALRTATATYVAAVAAAIP